MSAGSHRSGQGTLGLQTQGDPRIGAAAASARPSLSPSSLPGVRDCHAVWVGWLVELVVEFLLEGEGGTPPCEMARERPAAGHVSQLGRTH